MTDMADLIKTIQNTPDCAVYPRAGRPEVREPHVLPADVREFYRHCGGVSLFESSAYAIRIVQPENMVQANPVIFDGVDEAPIEESREDISWSWYIIAEGDNRQYITIDLAPERLGRCYDSFWDTHASPGYCAIVAVSFTDLLSRLLANQGSHWYWLQPRFKRLGDAYFGLK